MYGSVQAILTDKFGLSKFSALWVPKALHVENMAIRVDDALNFLNCFNADLNDFICWLVTSYKTWVYQYQKSPF